MDRGSFACALLIAALGCAFDSTADGDSASTLGMDTGESSTEVPPTGTSTAAATTDHATSASSTQSGTSSGEPSTTTVADDAARLVLSDHDFGVVGPGTNDSAMLDVSNEGGVAATELAVSVDAPFGLAGGTWPGEGGTCGEMIGPGKSCTVVIAFAPPAFGSWDRELVLAYAGGDEADARSMMSGASAGTTPNLIVNGDAEAGGDPPSNWTNVIGTWTTRTDMALANGGTRSINGGPFPDVATAQLQQIVPLAGYDALVDGGALTYAFASFARSFGINDDPYQIRLAFLDGANAEVGNHDFGAQNETAYQSLATTNVVPAGTRSIAVDLFCHKQAGGNCSAFFDDLSLTLSYVAP